MDKESKNDLNDYAGHRFDGAVVDFRIGQALKEARESRGLTQSQLGELMDVQKARISSIEKGSNLTIGTLRRVLRALGLKAALIIEGGNKIDIC